MPRKLCLGPSSARCRPPSHLRTSQYAICSRTHHPPATPPIFARGFEPRASPDPLHGPERARGGFPSQYLVLGRNIYIGHFSEPFRAITESLSLRLLRGTASEISPISSLPFDRGVYSPSRLDTPAKCQRIDTSHCRQSILNVSTSLRNGRV